MEDKSWYWVIVDWIRAIALTPVLILLLLYEFLHSAVIKIGGMMYAKEQTVAKVR